MKTWRDKSNASFLPFRINRRKEGRTDRRRSCEAEIYGNPYKQILTQILVGKVTIYKASLHSSNPQRIANHDTQKHILSPLSFRFFFFFFFFTLFCCLRAVQICTSLKQELSQCSEGRFLPRHGRWCTTN